MDYNKVWLTKKFTHLGLLIDIPSFLDLLLRFYFITKCKISITLITQTFSKRINNENPLRNDHLKSFHGFTFSTTAYVRGNICKRTAGMKTRKNSHSHPPKRVKKGGGESGKPGAESNVDDIQPQEVVAGRKMGEKLVGGGQKVLSINKTFACVSSNNKQNNNDGLK